MSFVYRSSLYLNLLKSFSKKIFEKKDSKHLLFLKNYFNKKKMVFILMLDAITQLDSPIQVFYITKVGEESILI